MRSYTLPTNWEKLSLTQLQARLEEIKTYAAEVTEETLDTPADSESGVSGIEYARSLAEAKTSVEALIGEKETAAAAEAEDRAAVLAALAEPDPEPEPEDAPTEEEAPAPAGEMAAEETPVEPTEDTPAELAPAEETPAEDPPVEATAEPAAAAADQTPAPAPQKDAAQALANMNAKRSADELPQAPTEVRTGRMRAVGTTGPDGWQEGSYFDDIDALSAYMSNKIGHIGGLGSWEGPRTQITLMQSNHQFEDKLMAEAGQHNFAVLDNAARAYQDTQEAIVASGGICPPQMPSYDFTSCYSPQRPVEAGIPVVGAPRGGIRFLNQVPLGGEAAAAITIKDAAASALLPGDPGYVPKNCTRVSCPTETEVTVASVSWCVTFDNLNFRVFPEQVRNMLERVQIEFTKAKEIFYLNRIDALSGPAIDIDTAQANPMGAGRSLFRDLIVSGHNYRKRNNMGRDAMLDVWLPDVVEDSLAIDMVNDPDLSAVGSIVAGPSGNLTQVLAQRARMNVMFYYYDATAAGFPASAHDGAAGVWNVLPTDFRSYMYAPGAIIRLDAGQLDLGIVRDSPLNENNDLQLFAEQWIEVARPGCEIVAHDHTACYSGVGPLGVAAPACP